MSGLTAPLLGISVYLSEPEPENLARLAACPGRGITRAFTSLHIPEDTNVADQPRLLRALGEAAAAAGVRLYADVSPLTLRRLDLPVAGDVARLCALGDWGVGGVRFDDGFGMGVIAATSRELPVQINASTVTASETRELLAAGARGENIEVLHNYYPREDTGLARAAYARGNLRFRADGMRVGAFVPGDGKRRGPLHAGLPTLEEHRDAEPFTAAIDCWRGGEPGTGADTVYVGDIDLSPDSWARWPHLARGVAALRWQENGTAPQIAASLRGRVLSNRADECDRVIRVRESRPMIGEESTLAAAGLTLAADSPGAGAPRPRGSVTVDNAAYGRYSGEIQLTRVDRPADPRVNVIGQVHPADLGLLDLLPGGALFTLV